MTYYKLSLEKLVVSLRPQNENMNTMNAINTNQANQNYAAHSIYMVGNGAMGSFPGIAMECNRKSESLHVNSVTLGKYYGLFQSTPVNCSKQYGSFQSAPVNCSKQYGSFHSAPMDCSKQYGSFHSAPVDCSKQYGSFQSASVHCSKQYGSFHSASVHCSKPSFKLNIKGKENNKLHKI